MSMELDNTFTVPVPPETAWDVLLDVARIAPCMPGATVDEVDGDVVTGRIKIKVGPVQLTYRGTAKFHERDEAARTVVVEASGKETRGAGTAAATIKATLEPAEGGATQVTMHTTMNVTGRPAQFGRGVMVEVGGKLVDKFAENLAQQLAADTATTTDSEASPAAAGESGKSGESGETATETPREAGATAAEGTTAVAAATATGAAEPAREDSINLVRLVGPAVLKRIVPVAAIAAAAALLGRWIKRGMRRGEKG